MSLTTWHWAVELYDEAGRDAGMQVCSTWQGADAAREAYSAPLVNVPGSERIAIVLRASSTARIGYHPPAPTIGPS